MNIMKSLNLPQLSIFEIPTPSNPPTKINEPKTTNSLPQNLFDPLEKAFKEIFPQDVEEETVLKMRRILGKKGNELSDERVQCIATEFQFLIDTWLDEFEKDIFNGMTLKEVINEK